MQIGGLNNEGEMNLPTSAYNTQKTNTSENEISPKKDENVEEQSTPKQMNTSQRQSEIKKYCRENELKFSIHEGTNRIMIKVINRDTQKVVKEIPEEKILDMIAQMYENAGICIDEKK